MTEGQRLIQQGEAKGRAEGRAAALLAVARGLAISSEQQAMVLSCRDIAILDRWVARAATAGSVDDVLSGEN